jgi:hypothetical protein
LRIVLCNAGPLIALGKLNQIELLLLTIAARSDIWISARLCHQILAELGKELGAGGV